MFSTDLPDDARNIVKRRLTALILPLVTVAALLLPAAAEASSRVYG